MFPYSTETDYQCWLNYRPLNKSIFYNQYRSILRNIVITEKNIIIESIKNELYYAIKRLLNIELIITETPKTDKFTIISRLNESELINKYVTTKEKMTMKEEGYLIKKVNDSQREIMILTSRSFKGLLYGTFELIKFLQMGKSFDELYILENPLIPLRIINHWDNLDGSIERGYASKSIFYSRNKLVENLDRIRDYARLLSSIGVNSIVINNVNVGKEEAELINNNIDIVEKLYEIFKGYGLKIFLSINFASPIIIGGLDSADPLNSEVRKWWKEKVKFIYEHIPDFGGFLVKADSEGQPGPFYYNRTHVDGANMLADALAPYNGLLIWRAFVYNCYQDWRDKKTDRAKSAYDTFKPLDGKFADNVIIQIKNGPMDFQVREPVNPLFGGLLNTNEILELQITQEYTGQQKHLCYLVPQWKEVLDFDTHLFGKGTTVAKIISGLPFNSNNFGIAGISNIGDESNWTGHTLAQANLYGFGRFGWNPHISAEEVTKEWMERTFGCDKYIENSLSDMMMKSWNIYEKYTAPLGVGLMVNPGHHYGPNVDGYEYSRWGTYHRADHFGIGVDRTLKSGIGYTRQYHDENFKKFEYLDSCPDELLLFFHHVSYIHKLKNNKTVIQHIYDSHFEGVEEVQYLIDTWKKLKGSVDNKIFDSVLKKLLEQKESAIEWRDVINSYFYRKTMINDEKGRIIY